MSELSKALGNSGAAHEVECNGKVYRVKLIDQGVKVAFEKKLYQHAKDAVVALRKDLDSDQFVEMLSKLTTAYEQGEFAMESARCRKIMKTPKGSMILMSLLLGCDEHEALLVMSQKPQEFKQVLDVVIKESFPGAKVEVKNSDESEDDDSPKA
jgi:hypothetical protein